MKKPRMINFLDGNDYGPLTVDEGKRYSSADKAVYLATRIAYSPEPVLLYRPEEALAA